MTQAVAAHVDEGATPVWLAQVVADAAAAATTEECAARLAPLFIRTRWLETMIEQWLVPLKSHPTALASLPTTRSGSVVTMMLAATPPVRLMVTAIDGAAERAGERPNSAPTISFSGTHALYLLLSPQPVDATLAYASPGVAHCRSRSILLCAGTPYSFDERRLAVQIAPQECPILLLRARIEMSPPSPLRRYALETGALVGTVQSDEGFARSAMLLSVLRAAGARDSIPVMIDMLAHHNAGERWTAMRELLALDARTGWPHLEIMASSDPEPNLREVALATLARLRSLPPEHTTAPCPA